MPIEHQDLIVREHERLACRHDALLHIESGRVVLSGAGSDGPDTLPAEVVDCSAGGVGLQTDVFLPRGCPLRLRISHPDLPALNAPLRIQRVTMTSREPTYYLGAAFVDLDPQQDDALQRLLQRLRASQPAPGPKEPGGA